MGKWSGVLRHFDGIQLGLTATPCTAEADMLPDPEDGHFVRDTLRFFELERADLPLHPSRGHRPRASGPVPHLHGDDGQDGHRGRVRGGAQGTRLDGDGPGDAD